MWLRNVMKYNQESCILFSIKENIIMLHEDTIKGDKSKYISLNFFLHLCTRKSGEINIQEVR